MTIIELFDSRGIGSARPRVWLAALLGVVIGLVLSSPARAAAERPPNIVFILADDLGWAELGSYGNTFNETPNLDRLAKLGTRYTQAYAAAPVCSPFRVSLMTGQWPARVGITDYLRPDASNHLSTEYVTIAELLKRRGYATGIVGKWHLSGYRNHGAEESPPNQHGFDEVMVSENRGIGGGSYFHPYHFNREIEQRLKSEGSDGREFLVGRCNLEAVEFIERHKDGPFFLYLSHYAVHTRLVGRPDLVAKYSKKPGAGLNNNAPRNNVHLAAQLEVIDDGIGLIMRKLDALGLTDNTLLIFTSDNGGEANVTSNAPLRGGKSMLYEGGIREPLIVRWPDHVTAGAVCDTPVCSVDWYPTLASAAGAEPDPKHKVDGVSIAATFTDAKASLNRPTLYWHYPLEKPHFLGGQSAGAIRDGDWKLIELFDTGSIELYDLAHDVSESTNLADVNRDVATQLRDKLKAWRADVGAVEARQQK